MARKRMEVEKLVRLENRARALQGAGRLVFVFFCAALGFVVVATAFPQRRELQKLETRLEQSKARERTVVSDQEHRHIELKALRQDPTFLEIQARDRLDFCADGERVLRMRHDR